MKKWMVGVGALFVALATLWCFVWRGADESQVAPDVQIAQNANADRAKGVDRPSAANSAIEQSSKHAEIVDARKDNEVVYSADGSLRTVVTSAQDEQTIPANSPVEKPMDNKKLGADSDWPSPAKSRFVGKTIGYRAVELPPNEKGGKPGELREWLVEPNEGYTAHVEEEYRPDVNGEMKIVGTKEYVANQVVLTLDGETSFDEFKKELERHGVVVKNPLMELEKGAKIVAVMLPDVSFDAVACLEQVVAAYDSRLVVERDAIGMADRTPDDARYSSQWGLTKIQAPSAWDLQTDASAVVVAVIDTGVNYNHQDLAGNMWIRSSSAAASNFKYGMRCIRGVITGNPLDDHGHGSHCAGIIGAIGNNSTGVSGVAWKTRIMACKALNSSGSYASTDLIVCMEWARTNGAHIVSMSCGGNYSYDAEYNAISRLRSSGVIAVCAAGNDGRNNETTVHSPSSYTLDNIVAVASASSSDGLSSFSNFGSTSVDIAAPGEGILSTVGVAGYGQYESWSGTSMATPFVSGSLALLKARFPSYTYLQLIQKLYAGGDSISALSGKCTTGKRLNVYKAISGGALVSPVPTASRGTYSDRVYVSWPTVSGATYYRVYRATSATGSKTALGSWQTGTSYTDYVSSGTTYYYWVCAATSSSGANQSSYGSYASGYAQASTGDSWDPGDDTPSGGTTVTPSTSRSTHGTHTLSGTDKYDFFKISMTAGTTYTFETTSTMDTYGELFNSTSTNTSNRVTYNDDGGTNFNFRIQYTPTTSGTYYLRVRAYSVGTSGSYVLAYQRSGTRDSWDPTDDAASGGTSITPTTTVQTHGPHSLSSDDRYDFFRISMTAGRTYVFESTGSYDMYGELFSSTSTNASYRVAYNDDGGDSYNFRLEYTPTTSQTYYLRVRRYSVGADGSYSLKYSYRQSNSLDLVFRNYAGWSDAVILTSSTNTMAATSTFQTNQTVWVCYQFVETDEKAVPGPVTNCAKVINQSTGATRFTYQNIFVGGLGEQRYGFSKLDIPGLEAGAYTLRMALNEDGDGNHGIVETTYTNNVRMFSFTVVNPQKTLSSIAISGNASIPAKGNALYRCIATYSDGSTGDVTPTWSISSNAAYATVDSSGRLTAADTTVDRTITLRAVFSGKSATKTIAIRGTAEEPDPVNPFPAVVSYPSAPMIVEGKVYINDVLAAVGDQIAAYSGNECRGVARIVANGRVTMGVNVAEAGERISFKVWDASEGDNGTIYNCLQTLSASSEPQGTASSPIRLDAAANDPFGQVTPEPLVPPTIIEASVTIDGAAASYGDILAVFSGNTIVGKAVVNYSNNGGIATATCRPVMFFSGRKALSFRLWDADEQKILESSATLTLSAGDVQGTVSNPYVIAFTSEESTPPCAVSLNSGWNLVSFSALPDSPTPATVFSQVSSYIQYVSDVSGNLWGPAIGNSGLNSLRLGAGYWVRSSANNVTWNVEGRGDTELQISLSTGWNLIGYTLPRAGQIADVLRTALASGKIQYITDQSGNVYPGGSLSNLRPGVGYWLRTTGAYSLKFDKSGMATAAASLAMVADSVAQNAAHPFGTPVVSVGMPTVFDSVSVSLFGKTAAYGDYLAVYDRATDNLVSVQQINSEDGTVTFTIMGLRANDKFYFKVWNAASGLNSPEIFTTASASDLTITNPDNPVTGLSVAITGTKPTYTVNYNLDNKGTRTGGGALTQTVAFGGDAVDPVVSPNSGYTFVDWDIGKRTDIRGPLTITALYAGVEQPATYTITYKPGAYGVGSQQTDTKTENIALTLKGAIFNRTGYTQTGWATSDGGAKVYGLGAPYTANAGITLYPFWTPNQDANSIIINVEGRYETEPDGTFGTVGANGTRSFDLGACVESLSTPRLTVKGLPAGLKFDARSMTISGAATKPGVYKVTVSATNATVKQPVTATFELTVPNLSCEALPNLEPATDAYGIVTCGVAFEPWLVDCSPEDGWTVKAAGLPTGLKLVKDNSTGVYSITGVPTKAGTYTVTFTASKRGERNQVATITLNVAATPEWAMGTFSGYVENDGFGSATMTVTANGKVSGKIALDGTNWTVKADSYSAVDFLPSNVGGGAVETNFIINAVATAGKAKRVIELYMAPSASGGALINAKVEGGSDDGEWSLALWRGMWKDKSSAAAAKTEIAKWEGVYTLSMEPDGDCGSGYLSLTVGKDGNVKATGKLADGTSVSATSPLMYDEEEGWFAFFCSAPSAYKGGVFAVSVGFEAPKGTLSNRLGIAQWSSRNPQATYEYDTGFDRGVDFSGAYYDKLEKLSAYYQSLLLSLTDVPMLSYTYKYTYVDDDTRRMVTESWVDYADAVDTWNQAGMTVSVSEKGAFVVAKATKPEQDKTTKEWRYNGTNDGALTLSFTQATGIFKGSYTFWYDYESAYNETLDKSTIAHASKKVNFEGILVQGENEMRGFYLWDALGVYDDPKTGKEKTYKYKESYPVYLVRP